MSLDRLVAVNKALADPNRIRALHACRKRELCVCQIVELLGLAPSTVSKHLRILRDAGLVRSHKRGRWIYYRGSGAEASLAAREATQVAMSVLARDPALAKDQGRLREILEMDPDALCLKQRRAPTRPGGGRR